MNTSSNKYGEKKFQWQNGEGEGRIAWGKEAVRKNLENISPTLQKGVSAFDKSKDMG